MIHETAIIDPAAELAHDVSVGPYSVIGPRVRIGAGSVIGPHVVIRGPTTLGAGNRIFQFASIGDDPQDKKFAGEDTRLEIGDRNTIREYCTINRGTAQDAGVTRVGNDNWLMSYTHIAHDCQVGNDVIMSNNATLAGHVHVEDHVILSGFCAVHQFCRIGAHAFVGGLSGVTRDVLPFMMVAGHPPEPRGINQEGLKRRGFGPEQLRNLKEAYRILYRSGLRLVEAREQLAALAASQPEVRAIVEFLDRSERSIVR
ncbi:UDP-N-acetylglucosamine acyltransferase [Gammaproteobacteria bacterium]|nr:acyl-ACP--UDP-N-acetylglucosamine O-acyltransferase [Gammaproteobacteria bacterium]QOJ31316.1 MAG: acyl-ACP--UDP-N-acetylglucosamine O-acyltransferase [Gammaproteobacteria bacterium]CAG0939242.1 UDP-N-acetylglucosamine acyltransferase [Gammaproteobacteria bacterium]